MALIETPDTADELRSRLLAIGYATGRRDAMPALTRMDAPVPTEFAQAYVDAVNAYNAGALHWRPILTEAYDCYRETGRCA